MSKKAQDDRRRRVQARLHASGVVTSQALESWGNVVKQQASFRSFSSLVHGWGAEIQSQHLRTPTSTQTAFLQFFLPNSPTQKPSKTLRTFIDFPQLLPEKKLRFPPSAKFHAKRKPQKHTRASCGSDNLVTLHIDTTSSWEIYFTLRW